MPQGARPKVSRQQARRRAQPYASKTRTRVKKGAGIKGGRKNFNDVKGKMMKVRVLDWCTWRRSSLLLVLSGLVVLAP